MWRRLVSSSISASLKTLASSSSRSSPRALVRPLTSLSSSSSSRTNAFPSHNPVSSPSDFVSKGKKKIEDVMPIATGHEREELEAELEGSNVLEANYPVGPFGTEEAPAIVKSIYDRRIVGCCGGEGEDEHDVVWFWLHKDQPHVCPVCSQYFKLEVIGAGGSPYHY